MMEYKEAKPLRDIRVWSVIVVLCIANLLVALESTVLITSLPTVIKDLSMDDDYVWVNNIFFLSRWVKY